MDTRSTGGRERLWVQRRVLQTASVAFGWLCGRWVRHLFGRGVARAICEVCAGMLAGDVREALRKGFEGWRAEILRAGQGVQGKGYKESRPGECISRGVHIRSKGQVGRLGLRRHIFDIIPEMEQEVVVDTSATLNFG